MPTIKNSNDLAFQIYDKNVQARTQGNEFQLNSYSNSNQSNVNSTPFNEFVSVRSSGQDGSEVMHF